MFQRRADRPITELPYLHYVYENEMIPFGWDKNPEGWIIKHGNHEVNERTKGMVFLELNEANETVTDILADLTELQKPLIAEGTGRVKKAWPKPPTVEDFPNEIQGKFEPPKATQLPSSNPLGVSSIRDTDKHIAKIEKELLELRRQYKQTKLGWSLIMFHIGAYEIHWFLIEGDHSKFEQCFINWYLDGITEAEQQKEARRQEKLADLIYDKEGNPLRPSLDRKQWLDAIKSGAKLVECGYSEIQESEE